MQKHLHYQDQSSGCFCFAHFCHSCHSEYDALDFSPVYLTTRKSRTSSQGRPDPRENLRECDSHPAFRIRLSSVSSCVHPCSTATSGKYVAPCLRYLWVNVIRIPCLPSSQSMGPSHSSKSASRVNEHERPGTSFMSMG